MYQDYDDRDEEFIRTKDGDKVARDREQAEDARNRREYLRTSVYDFVHVASIGEGFQVAQGIWDEEAGGYQFTVDILTGCQDRGCLINPPKQGTNGGCRCLKYLPTSLRIGAKKRIRHLQGKAWATVRGT